MRVAVISDVHGNRLALEAVLADIDDLGADMTINLGDIVSGPLDPSGTAERLLEADLPTVRGNHDRTVLIEESGPVDSFVRKQLGKAQLDWLEGLPSTLVLAGEIFMCHGTPDSDMVPWLDSWLVGRSFELPDEGTVTANAAGIDCPVLLCGHTHVPRLVRLADGRLVVNPGSVGLQMNYGAPDARYAIIERRGGKWSATFRAVPYDHDAAARQAVANGFPQWRDALMGGWAAAQGLF